MEFSIWILDVAAILLKARMSSINRLGEPMPQMTVALSAVPGVKFVKVSTEN